MRGEPPGELSVQINADKLTLAVAKVPQVYLSGAIDAGAAERLTTLVRSGKIPPGSDIYLNAPGGDIRAGMALGRLFRSGAMSTHLGVPRRSARTPTGSKAALCTGACTYAYMGGLYRWAPTGNDRFGVPPIDGVEQKATDTAQASQAPDQIKSYLQDMDIRAEALASAAPHDADGWLTADQMLASGLSNNGRLAPTATYHLMSGAPYLTLGQSARDGEHRITLLCKPEGLTLTAYYMVGVERARKIAARANRSYFEVDQQPTLQGDHASVTTASESIVISRPIPLTQLAQFLAAHSMGAWLADRGGAVRYGFTMDLDAVKTHLKSYSSTCAQMAKLPGPGRS